ncbi:YceK/YidQ family lipoprotein [Leminorella grimontii]|uniref:YceK/YidQ family lipoprotein n=1 Tax=Leminorella grimontii TaxID=82981 RepID=UPI00321F6650
MRFLITSGILLTTLFLSGCSSIVMRSTGYDDYAVYPGVRESVKVLNYRCSAACIEDAIIKPLLFIDLPFSFVLDTVLLPVDGVIYGVSSDKEESESH